MADLLKDNLFENDFEIKVNETLFELFKNTVGTAELIEMRNGALFILKIPVDKRLLKDTVEIIKDKCKVI